MNTFQFLIRPVCRLALFAAVVATCATARAGVTRMSANPSAVHQGGSVTLSAYVDRGGRVDFFFLGRPVGTVFPARAGWVSVRYAVPNVVPAGSQCIDKAWSAQQNGHRVSDVIRVCR